MTNDFAKAVIHWFKQHGRHDLPWQRQATPYRVWVSEIMLQQTQVATVIPYYERFMHRFPTVAELAAAPADEVLHLWTGLGYYARARNLHRTAQIIHAEFRDAFPDTVNALSALPGIGRSTAGAILALGMGIHASILDGNVKRVLCRYHAVTGWPDQASTLKTLWTLTEAATPEQDTSAYTQAMMDLGATVCTRSNPRCSSCPVQQNCQAFQSGRTAEFPKRKPGKKVPVRKIHMLMSVAQNARDSDVGSVLLEKRPATGIWGSLWSFPEYETLTQLQEFCLHRPGFASSVLHVWKPLRHSFSHFHLEITPVQMTVKISNCGVMDSARWLWYPLDNSVAVGLAAPVKKLLQQLST